MRRTLRSRLCAAIFALWFTTALSEPAAFHTCAQHSAAHAGHEAAHGATSHHGAPPSHHETCTCIGGCCVAVTATIPTTPTIALASAEAATEPTLTPGAPSHRHITPEYARPPSHAPPVRTA